jgi:glycosyltransferase involved in cell wall biosynthesis
MKEPIPFAGYVNIDELSVAVVTSTIGRPVLEETIHSVITQTRQARHYVFVHGKEFWEKSKVILDKYPLVEAIYLPNNNGGYGYGMAPVYAMAGFVVSEDVICYLDDDNFYEPDHIERSVDFMEQRNLEWVFALRNIVDSEGKFLIQDNCDSIGYYPNSDNNNLVDNSCMVVKTKHARQLGAYWYVQIVSDKNFLAGLLVNKLTGGTTGKHTVNYRLSKDGSGCITHDSIIRCNKEMEEKYHGDLPWLKESCMTIKEESMTDKPSIRLFIATPMYGGLCNGQYAVGLLQSVSIFSKAGISMQFAHMMNESLITRARNSLAYDFLETDSTHMMFIDADIGFNPADIPMMIEADKDIICGLYPKKEINWPRVQKAVKDGYITQDLHKFVGSFVVNAVGNTVQGNVADPVEITNGGTGFMLIKREVFEGLADKVPFYHNDMFLTVDDVTQVKVIKEFFATSIEPDTKRLLSEDYHFCKIAREAGYKVYAAPWAELTHCGSYNFNGYLGRKT